MFWIIVIVLAVVIIFSVRELRIKFVSEPLFKYFKRALPSLSDTEREAMEAGSVWWDGALFSGRPNWRKWLENDKPQLSDSEKAFIANELQTLLTMLDEPKFIRQKDLDKVVWDYLKENGFFSFIIPKAFGGKEFSAQACSEIVAKIASRSLSTAVTVMVPNSLGPAELLLHYGTTQQQDTWLPKLSIGKAVPCFALTSLEAGSDAGSITDSAIVCEQVFEGKSTLGLSVTWSKRYITLAPIADVLGLAVKVYDPEGLIGTKQELGITCLLIPTSHEGVEVGARHDPMGLSFMNGTTSGESVFVPMSWVIGEEAGVGKGWRMLMSCLSAGRGISLPALSAGTAHLCSRTSSAYCNVRYQFNCALGQFEGVQSKLADILGKTYLIEAARQVTALAVDLKQSPSIISAIAKYHLSELARDNINDAMDVHGGKAIQLGKKNYLAINYMGMPISITVEGANILTRNLMIFGQGATRCHPYILKEMEIVAQEDEAVALKSFDKILSKHLQFTSTNAVKLVMSGLTFAKTERKPVSGEVAKYYQQLTWMSLALSVLSDIAMLKLGGSLKRREMLSARLGDVLSHLYLASCVLKKYEDDGRQQSDYPMVKYALDHSLKEIGDAIYSFLDNFTHWSVAFLLKRLVFPLGSQFTGPTDELKQQVVNNINIQSARERVSHLCTANAGDEINTLETAYSLIKENKKLFDTYHRWLKAEGVSIVGLSLDEILSRAGREANFTEAEIMTLSKIEKARISAISVDTFNAQMDQG